MIRTGIVGFGMASRVFHAPLISAVEGFALAAVVERSTRNAEKLYPNIATYPTLDTMLEDKSIELIVIATPNPSHFPLAKQALEADRHVVVDKPAATTSGDIRTLIAVAAAHNRLVTPFHNRRWDNDFLTLRKVLSEETLGRVVHFQSTFDRWRPAPRLTMWKENGDPGGGILLDLGTHIADQALQLFGLPESVSAQIVLERDKAVNNDAFTLTLRYPELRVELSANCLASLPRPRFTVRGTNGNFVKYGLDPQEARLKAAGKLDDSPSAPWGEESASAWGTIAIAGEDATGQPTNDFTLSRVKSLAGDYRHFYAGVRDAIQGKAKPPVDAEDALHVAQLLEWAQQSSQERREIPCL